MLPVIVGRLGSTLVRYLKQPQREDSDGVYFSGFYEVVTQAHDTNGLCFGISPIRVPS